MLRRMDGFFYVFSTLAMGILGLFAFLDVPVYLLIYPAGALVILILARLIAKTLMLDFCVKYPKGFDRKSCSLHKSIEHSMSEYNPYILASLLIWFTILILRINDIGSNSFILKLLEKFQTAFIMFFSFMLFFTLTAALLEKLPIVNVLSLKLLRKNKNHIQ